VQFPEEPRPPDTETALGRFYVDVFIAWAFITLQYLVCLLHIFSKL
jgi:hypothetical protein